MCKCRYSFVIPQIYKAGILCWEIWIHCWPQIIKIILHRIISVVWLTNFLSEIRNLINPRWWVEQQLLSVKRYQNSLQRSETLMIAHLPFTGGWRELVLSEWFSLMGKNCPLIEFMPIIKNHKLCHIHQSSIGFHKKLESVLH